MKKIAAIILILSASLAKAETTICTNRGNMEGSFYLDITGFEALAQDDTGTMIVSLGFKPFRSWVSEVDTLVCSKAGTYQHGPAGVIACKSETGSTYQVEVLQLEHLVARVSKFNSDEPYSEILCQITE